MPGTAGTYYMLITIAKTRGDYGRTMLHVDWTLRPSPLLLSSFKSEFS